MRVQCDVCERAPASVMCCADEAVLCVDCDLRVHAANKLANKHHRVPLHGNVGESPRCDICQEKNGFFFCLEDRAVLCRDCDVSIHSVNKLAANHQRFLLPGTKVALEAICGEARSPEVVPESVAQQPHPHPHPLAAVAVTAPVVSSSKLFQLAKPAVVPPAPQPTGGGVSSAGRMSADIGSASVPCRLTGGGVLPGTSYAQSFSQAFSGGVMRRSSISEYLTESVPGWRVEELLNIPELAEGYSLGDVCSSKADVQNLGDFDWTADLSLFDEQVYAESLHEVPQLPSVSSVPALSRPGRVTGPLKGKGKQDMALVPEFDDAFIVPDIGRPSAPASPPVVKRRRLHLGV